MTEFKELLKRNTAIIIDIRTPAEFLEEKILNSININFYAQDFSEKVSSLDKSKTY